MTRRYHEALLEEAAGNAIIVMMDESYIHQRHHSEMSYLPTMASGARRKRKRIKSDVTRDSRDGLRGCFAHAITKYGAVITHDDAGSPVRDCEWRGSALRRNHVPLNSEGEPCRSGDMDAHTMEMFFV